MDTSSLMVWVDGTAKYDIPGRPTNGPNARIGAMWTVWAGTKCLEEDYRELGAGTVNQAEFVGIILGIKAALAYKPKTLVVYSDSQVAVNAINKKNLNCTVYGADEWIPAIWKAVADVENFKLVYIKRHKNRADGLNRRLKKEKALQDVSSNKDQLDA